MGKIEINSKVDTFHGKTGNYIHYYVKGYHYVRTYTIPRNPRSAAQQKNRNAFADAVKLWQELTQAEQAIYNRISRKTRYSGYNLFISMCMKGMSLPEIIAGNSIRVQGMSFHVPHMLRATSVSTPFTARNDPVCLRQPLIVTKKPVYTAA